MTPIPYKDWLPPPGILSYGAAEDDGLCALRTSAEDYVVRLLSEMGSKALDPARGLAWPLLVAVYQARSVYSEAAERALDWRTFPQTVVAAKVAVIAVSREEAERMLDEEAKP